MILLHYNILRDTHRTFAGYTLLVRMFMYSFDQHQVQENSEQEIPVAYPCLYMVKYPHLSKIGEFLPLQQRCNKYFSRSDKNSTRPVTRKSRNMRLL